nr:hypothetical protein [Tanacetum cinerariifolium]
MAEDGKLKIDNMMVMISVSVRCRSKTLYIRRSFRSLWQKPNLQKGHFQKQCSKLVASRDKVVNMTAGDSDDALVCCVKNMVEDHIMDSGASFHATYCKKELERFKLRSDKHWRLGDMSRIAISMLASKCNVPNVRKKVVALHLLHKCEDPATMILLSKTAEGVARAWGFVQRLRRWYGQIQLVRLLNLLHALCPDRVVYSRGEMAREIYKSHTLEGRGSDEMRYSFQDTKSHHVIQIRDITFVDSIYGARAWVDSKITQILGESSDTSEGSENYGSFKDSGRSDDEYSEDGASCKEGGSETPHVQRSTRESRAPKKAINENIVSLEKNHTCSLVRLLTRKKASQRLWMFKVKEEQDGSKRDTKSLIHLVKNLKFCSCAKLVRILISEGSLSLLKILGTKEPCRDVHQVGDEREVEVLRNFNWPSSELITEDGVLPER